jgi:hypothetical protein
MDAVKAILFDSFGTVVDWRGSLIDELTAFGSARGIAADRAGLTAAAHNGDLHAARNCGLKAAFFPRPTEYGPHQIRDFAADIEDLAARMGA